MTNQNQGQFSADPEDIKLARQLDEARANQRQWKEIADTARDEILARFDEISKENDDADVKALVSGGVKVISVSESVRKSLDIEALKTDYPDIDYDKYMKVSYSRTVRPGRI